MNIRLSEEYGLNPSMTTCFYCGQHKDIVLFGAGYRDKTGKQVQAPSSVGVVDMEPCRSCKEHMKQGVILISVRDGECGDNPYRTGGFVVVRDEAISRAFNKESAEVVLVKRMAFVDDTAWYDLGLPELPKEEK